MPNFTPKSSLNEINLYKKLPRTSSTIIINKNRLNNLLRFSEHEHSKRYILNMRNQINVVGGRVRIRCVHMFWSNNIYKHSYSDCDSGCDEHLSAPLLNVGSSTGMLEISSTAIMDEECSYNKAYIGLLKITYQK